MLKRRPRAGLHALFLALPLLASCAVAGRRCDNVELDRVAAPDGAFDAVLYHRTCDEGAASTNISLVAGGAFVSEDIGNLFQAAGHPDSVAVALSWSGARVLTVRHGEGARLLKREDAFRGVTVRYVSGAEPATSAAPVGTPAPPSSR